MGDVEAAPSVAHGENGAQLASSTFTFADCKFGGKDKEILKGISGVAKSGEVLAIMGPSGAGKTMLLNLLTLEDGPGEVSGDVRLNGEPLTRREFQKHCAVVTQVDRHWAFLTCRESVALSADLYLGDMSAEEKAARVDAVLKRTGLESCADTKVGNQFFAGLSGGQKRRLSLAVALMKQPQLVFLDEPTSGLDAAAAASIMTWIKELAHDLNIIVVCTIHQPSAKVFAGFDNCMLLSDGRVAYLGPTDRMDDYLAIIGHPTPGTSSTAEHALDLVNREFSDKDEVDALLDKWPAHRDTFAPKADKKAVAMSADDAKKSKFGSSFGSQTMTLLKRHALLTVRDPMLYLGRFFAFLMSCAFFAVIYLNTRSRDQEQAIYKLFLMMWFVGVPSSLGVAAVFGYNMEYFSIRKEVKDGMYSPGAYVLATTILQIPLMFVLAIGAIGVSAYGIANFNAAGFGEYWLIYTVTLWSFECIAQFCAVMFENSLVGMLVYMNNWFSAFLFAGIMVPEEDVVWPFRVLCYTYPLRWDMTSFAQVDFRDTTFKGAEEDADGVYSCPGLGKLYTCYGYHGTDVLDTIGTTYRSISSENNTVRNVIIIIAIAVAFKLQYVALVFMKAYANREPKPK